MPAPLQQKRQQQQQQQQVRTTAAAASSIPKTIGGWTEYKDPKTGKTYFSDGVNTTWERPAAFKDGSSEGGGSNDESPKQPRKKKKTSHKKETKFGSKAEALAAFKGLLLAKGVLPTTKWHDVVKMCSGDSRWEACESLTLGERRQALAEYQTRRANELKDQERQERIRAKNSFNELLGGKLSSMQGFSHISARFIDVREALSNDARFYAVRDEATRESLFVEFCEEIRKREERKKRSNIRDAKEAFLSFLKEQEEKGNLSFASTWSSFLSSLPPTIVSDKRLQISPHMSDSDRELYFSDHVIELQIAEDEKRRRIREARRRAEKAQRDAFRNELIRLATEGALLPSTRWFNVESTMQKLEAYGPVKEQGRDAPRGVFEDFLEGWDGMYRRDRSILQDRLVNPTSRRPLVIRKDMSYKDFSKALLDQASYSPDLYADTRDILDRADPVSSAKVYFDELIGKAKQVVDRRRSSLLSLSSRRSAKEESSEDEGEIIEDGEIDEEQEEGPKQSSSVTNQSEDQDGTEQPAPTTGENKALDEPKHPAPTADESKTSDEPKQPGSATDEPKQSSSATEAGTPPDELKEPALTTDESTPPDEPDQAIPTIEEIKPSDEPNQAVPVNTGIVETESGEESCSSCHSNSSDVVVDSD